MSNDLILKVIRCGIVAFLFLCVTVIVGMEVRETHQFLFLLGVMVLFGLLLKNVWLTLFLWWTASLYIIYRFQVGHTYLINVFLGCILYYLTKLSFKKEHINFFINAVLWVACINLLYMVLQALEWDVIYSSMYLRANTSLEMYRNLRLIGFMGNTSYTAVLFAFAMPFLMTRQTKLSWIGSFGLFIPIVIVKSFMVLVAAIIGTLFILFFKISRKLWVLMVIAFVITGILFYVFVDRPGMERLSMWKLVLDDVKIHPVAGWGLDSFRTISKTKSHIYTKGGIQLDIEREGRKDTGPIVASHEMMSIWDNPHNLYVSLIFEWGILAWLFLGGYIRQCAIKFKNAVKEPNTLALAGFGVVFLMISLAHFPIFLARLAVIIIPAFALFEIQTK